MASPVPGPEEVLVRVGCSGVNRADLLQRQGRYPAPPGWPEDIPGLEFAGVVEAVGEGCRVRSVGDRVMGIVGGGGYAELLTTHERATVAIPERLSNEAAGAVPEVFMTAFDAVFLQCGLEEGETLLVHAVGSGVGTAAVQLGHALGAFVIGTARTADKLERARSLGLDAGVVPEAGRFADAVRKIAEPAVVLELVGGGYLAEDLRCLRPLGRIVVVGLLAGARQEVDLGLLMTRRARILGTVLRSRPLEEKLAAMRAFEDRVVPLLARGLLAPVIDAVMPLDDAARAHERMASNAGFGKIVLRV